jgi:hypothetical protein
VEGDKNGLHGPTRVVLEEGRDLRDSLILIPAGCLDGGISAALAWGGEGGAAAWSGRAEGPIQYRSLHGHSNLRVCCSRGRHTPAMPGLALHHGLAVSTAKRAVRGVSLRARAGTGTTRSSRGRS